MKRTIPPLLILVALVCAGCENQALRQRYDGPFVEQAYLYGDHYVEVDGVKIGYTTAGEGPPIIFMRGVGGTCDYWDETLPHFVDDFRVYALDLVGFGKSGKPDAYYSLEFHTRKVLGFMDALGIRKASFVGNSLGGHIAMQIAIEHPERVDRLAIQAATGLWEKPNRSDRFLLGLLFTDNFFYKWNIARWYSVWQDLVREQTSLSEEKLTYFIRMRHTADWREFCRAYSRSILGVFDGSLRHDVHRITAPTLILWGDADRRHPVRDARFLLRQIPDSRLVLFKGGGHMICWDFKDDFNSEIRAFLTNPYIGPKQVRVVPPYELDPTLMLTSH